ncbi:protein phosphatase inhibitor 2 [Cryptomeria japonica]|uniref:protein phosphatase inhibitor 2 n=1 Tax=Cryptomeria japonica TaxID=3369 RepID=UPI0025AB732B|nr:protein phosphatase inhibitor 2 [Cryptomeria japonica]
MKKNKLWAKVRSRVRWDETNLGEIEANKPVRQKINEPKTPYHAPQYEDGSVSPLSDRETSLGDAEHAEAVRSALSEVASSSREGRRQGNGWTSSEDEGDATEHDDEDSGTVVNKLSGNRLSFNDQRRAHYDEFRKAKELLCHGSALNEEDEEEEKERLESDSNSQ